MMDRIVEGWQVFERWAKRFRATAGHQSAFSLSTAPEVFDAEFFDPDECKIPTDARQWAERVNDRITFFRDYFVDISFDGGDFYATVKELLSHQSPRASLKSYGIWVSCCGVADGIQDGNLHFRGDRITLFCGELDQYDFTSIMNICPFDQLILRNKDGADWTKQEVRAFLKILREDLGYDGIKISTSPFWGDDYINGSLLGLAVKIKSPKGTFFGPRRD